jgi:hypothetical protein
MPVWEPSNLSKHFSDRWEHDHGCIEKLINIPSGQLSPGAYENFSKSILSRAFMAWKASAESKPGAKDHEPREFVIDLDLAMDILNEDKSKFITCYHLHRPGCIKHSTTKTTKGSLKARIRRYIEHEENQGRYNSSPTYHDVI